MRPECENRNVRPRDRRAETEIEMLTTPRNLSGAPSGRRQEVHVHLQEGHDRLASHLLCAASARLIFTAGLSAAGGAAAGPVFVSDNVRTPVRGASAKKRRDPHGQHAINMPVLVQQDLRRVVDHVCSTVLVHAQPNTVARLDVLELQTKARRSANALQPAPRSTRT